MTLSAAINGLDVNALGAASGNYLNFEQGKWSVIKLNRFDRFMRWIGIWYRSTTLKCIAGRIKKEIDDVPALRAKIQESWTKTYPKIPNHIANPPRYATNTFAGLPAAVKELLPQYLGFPAAAKLRALDCAHNALFERSPFRIKQVCMPVESLAKLFNSCETVCKVEELKVSFASFPQENKKGQLLLLKRDMLDSITNSLIRIPSPSNRNIIRRLEISELHLGANFSEPYRDLSDSFVENAFLRFLSALLAKTPSVRELKIICPKRWRVEYTDTVPEFHIRLGETARGNLKNLRHLDLSTFLIDQRMAIELLQSTQELISVAIPENACTNAAFHALAQCENLAHLSLTSSSRRSTRLGALHYSILEECKNFESFAPSVAISLVDMRRILTANPKLKKLDLLSNGANLPFHGVLALIAEKRPNIQHLSLPEIYVDVLTEAVEFVTQEILDEVTDFRELISFSFYWGGQVDPDLEAFISIPTLIHLTYYTTVVTPTLTPTLHHKITTLNVAEVRQQRLASNPRGNDRSVSSMPLPIL